MLNAIFFDLILENTLIIFSEEALNRMNLGCTLARSFQNIITRELFMKLKCQAIINIMHLAINENSDAGFTLKFIIIRQCPHFGIISDNNILRS